MKRKMNLKTSFKAFALTLALALIASPAFAQEILTPFGTTHDAPAMRGVAAARFLPFFDDFSHSNTYPDSTKWTDNNVLVNDGFPLCAPNRKGATFDVLDASGKVYSYAISNAFVAEYLTSARIRLDSIMDPDPRALTPADSIYLSFYYQPQGNGNPPEAQDSLVLQFGTTTERQEFLFLDYQNYDIADIFAEMQVDTLFPGDTIWASVGCQPGMFTLVTDTLTPDTQGSIAVPCDSVFTTVADTTWYHIWSVPGQTLEDFMAENDGQYFKQVMIPIRDLKYFRDDFYFRFYNYASIVGSSLPSNRSNEDNWNIDFVYLNINRSADDTDYPMLSFAGQQPSFFERYQSIPYRQYRVNPNAFTRENLEVGVVNLDGIDHEVNYYYTVKQIGGGQHYTRALDPVTVHPYKTEGYLQCPDYGESPACPYVGELFALNMWYDSVSYQVSHYIYDSTANPPLVDSMVYRTGMYNYYAYDDGIPELGFGVRPAGGLPCVSTWPTTTPSKACRCSSTTPITMPTTSISTSWSGKTRTANPAKRCTALMANAHNGKTRSTASATTSSTRPWPLPAPSTSASSNRATISSTSASTRPSTTSNTTSSTPMARGNRAASTAR